MQSSTNVTIGEVQPLAALLASHLPDGENLAIIQGALILCWLFSTGLIPMETEEDQDRLIAFMEQASRELASTYNLLYGHPAEA